MLHEFIQAIPIFVTSEEFIPWATKQYKYLDLVFCFSEFFRTKDQQDLWNYNERKVLNKKFRSLIALWKKPLEKKRLRQTRIK